MYEFKHIVVDGWNVIHSHPKLKKLLTSGNQDAARAELSSLLAPIHDFGGSRITIVYDGTGEDISIVRRSQILTFSEVFTPSNMTADELIEQLCSTSKNPDRILVVSRDNSKAYCFKFWSAFHSSGANIRMVFYSFIWIAQYCGIK